MNNHSLNNPHDRFVRRFLTDLAQARELIQWRLPSDVLVELNLDTIQPAKQSFISQTLRESLSDLVFDVQLNHGGSALDVFLFEHKSTPDEMTAFQVLRYIVEICDEQRRNSQPLSCVIPFVLYHGPRPWRVARSVPELVDVPHSLKKYVPQFQMQLIDLSECTDEELRGESIFLATMTLLKYIQRDELPERLPGILNLLQKLLPPATALQTLRSSSPLLGQWNRSYFT